MSKRILVMADNHSGHQTGLTPPDYWLPVVAKPKSDSARRANKFAALQREVWRWYTDTIKSLGKIDYVFHLGDNIDGRGEKSGGTELLTMDINRQIEMAAVCLQATGCKDIFMVYGTPYHVAPGYSDMEDAIAKEVKARKIGSREKIRVLNTVFDLRHKVGKSSIPHGQGTLLEKQRLWDLVWEARGIQERANVYLRGHIHDYKGVIDSDYLVLSCPGLEWSTKYGSREVDGIVSIGLIDFTVDEEGYTWRSHIASLAEQRVQTIRA